MYPQVLVTPPMSDQVVRHLIGHAHRPLSLKSLPDGSVMITGARLGSGGVVVDEEVEAGLADAAAVFPALDGVVPDRSAADRPESATPDFMPIIDQVASNVWVACGWTGHGFAIGPVVAELLVSWATTGTRPELLAPFGRSRFAE